MYVQVDIELAAARMNRKELAERSGIAYNTLLSKLSGKYPMTLDECFAIKKALGSKKSLEKLFERTESEMV